MDAGLIPDDIEGLKAALIAAIAEAAVAKAKASEDQALIVHPKLVGRVVHSAGYNLFNFTRAFSVVNRQSALVCFLLRSSSQASTSSFSIC